MQPGSLCICIVDGDWISKFGTRHPGPLFNENVVVDRFSEEGEDYLVFAEYPGKDEHGEAFSFNRMYFREIQPPMTLQIEELISETQTV